MNNLILLFQMAVNGVQLSSTATCAEVIKLQKALDNGHSGVRIDNYENTKNGAEFVCQFKGSQHRVLVFEGKAHLV